MLWICCLFWHVTEATHKGIEANVASILAVEVDGALEEGHSVREVALHLEGAHSSCTKHQGGTWSAPAIPTAGLQALPAVALCARALLCCSAQSPPAARRLVRAAASSSHAPARSFRVHCASQPKLGIRRFTPVRALVAVRPKPAMGAKALAEATAAARRTVLSIAEV